MESISVLKSDVRIAAFALVEQFNHLSYLGRIQNYDYFHGILVRLGFSELVDELHVAAKYRSQS